MRHGTWEVVHVTDVDMPVAGHGGLLLKVAATRANRADCGYRPATSRAFFTGLTRAMPNRRVVMMTRLPS
jgi:hypothetical protein